MIVIQLTLFVTKKNLAAYPRIKQSGSLLFSYLALLRVEIARFTPTKGIRHCCSSPHQEAISS